MQPTFCAYPQTARFVFLYSHNIFIGHAMLFVVNFEDAVTGCRFTNKFIDATSCSCEPNIPF